MSCMLPRSQYGVVESVRTPGTWRRRVGAQEDLLPAEAVRTEPDGPGSRLTVTSAPTGRGKLVHRSVGHALAELNRA